MRLACRIAHHSGPRIEAEQCRLLEQLGSFAEERTLVADALTYRDLTSDADGAPLYDGNSPPEDTTELTTHRPDSLRNRASVEIPLTAAGKAFFSNRATARDLALFVRCRRMHHLHAEPQTRELADENAENGDVEDACRTLRIRYFERSPRHPQERQYAAQSERPS
jgi:hypothetical protein